MATQEPKPTIEQLIDDDPRSYATMYGIYQALMWELGAELRLARKFKRKPSVSRLREISERAEYLEEYRKQALAKLDDKKGE